MPLARASLSARSTIYPRSDALARSTRIYEESDNEVDRMRDGDAKPNSDKKGSALAGRTVGKVGPPTAPCHWERCQCCTQRQVYRRNGCNASS